MTTGNFKVKILKERIPKSYDDLRRKIEALAAHKGRPPVIHKAAFWCVSE